MVKRVGQVDLVTDHQRKKNVLLYTYVYVLLRNKDIYIYNRPPTIVWILEICLRYIKHPEGFPGYVNMI